MDWFVKAFLKASLAWLALGVSLGLAMAAHPMWTIYRVAHMHMVLLGHDFEVLDPPELRARCRAIARRLDRAGVTGQSGAPE